MTVDYTVRQSICNLIQHIVIIKVFDDCLLLSDCSCLQCNPVLNCVGYLFARHSTSCM